MTVRSCTAAGIVFAALAAAALVLIAYVGVAAPSPVGFAYASGPAVLFGWCAWLARYVRRELQAEQDAADLAAANEREDHIAGW